MCGIAGFIDYRGFERESGTRQLKRMTELLAHRGPDADGHYTDDFAALGHRRLSIIDLASGQQPMADCDGRVQIVFNGEIYNFRELRAELDAAGHQFRTQSDTEVILEAYKEWGDEFVERLNGMFAFALWDVATRRMLLARDRVGKKPLYYFTDGARLVFASELKALRVDPDCPDSVDPESLDCYFSLGYIPAPRTIFRGVKKLDPAHLLVFTESGSERRPYWRLDCSQAGERSPAEVAEQFENILDNAVATRLISEVPLGAFLSGGLDSSLVVSSMSRILGNPVATHTIGFDDAEHSEVELARQIAGHLGTEHREFIVHPSASDVLGKIAWHFDEPFADSSALPTWYVCEAIRQSVTVALSGDGGDEGFAGYSFRYLPHVFESRIRSLIPAPLRYMLFAPLGSIWPASRKLPQFLRLKSIFENLSRSDVEAFYHDLIWLREDAREEVYKADFRESLRGFSPFEVVQPFYTRNEAEDALARSQYTDVNVYMTDDVLAKVDRMSMAHSLEVRSPLLDYRVLEFGLSLQAGHKMNRHQGKLPLRELAARRLPKEIASGKKQGFSIPAARWLRSDLRELAESAIFNPGGLVLNVLEESVVKKFWQEHLRHQRDHSVFLWGLMMLGMWERECFSPVGQK